MADLNRYSPAFFEPTIVPEQSSFGEVVGATLGLRFAPAIDAISTGIEFNSQERDPNFKWQDNLGDHALYATSLYGAKNAQHMARLKSNIDRGIERRQVLSNSTLLTQLGAGLFDPINFIALPLGGPTVGFARSVARVGAGTAVIEGTSELVNLRLDPVKTIEEATMNTASAALFGGAIGGAVSIPLTRRAAALAEVSAANRKIFDAVDRIENLEGMTPSDIRNAPARADRPFGSLEDAEIRAEIARIEAGADEANQPILQKGESVTSITVDGVTRTIEKRNPTTTSATQSSEAVKDTARAYRNELGLRQLEADGVDIDDPYNIKSSWFTDSLLYKVVSTPMKRTLQGKYPNRVKEIFLETFGDNGMEIAQNVIGKATPQSVAIRSAVAAGRWVKAQDGLVKLWAADTDASTSSRLDINFTDVSRRATRSDQTYRQWLTNVSEKRLRGITDMTENELKASGIINEYFKEAELRLEEFGLIGNAKGRDRQIEMLEAEIAALNSSLKGVQRTSEEFAMVRSRIKDLKEKTKFLKTTKFEPNENVEADVFFPRFFDKGAIRKNREEFASVLYNWFEQNPYIYKMKKGKAVRVELSTKPEKIKERVDQTIDNILGENDPLSLEKVSFGMGRSKHFRSRELDIPNRLVTDFMMKDPLAVMKTYAARIEPRYEFAKRFGKDLDGVRFELEREMIRDGKSQAEIDEVMRDFNHMYDRTIGTVLENPDAMNQKMATVLREAASFSYMGSSGLAAIPDFGRIVMEYDLENVWKGVQAILDKERLNMTVDEVRLAGEAIDILKGSAHMRMYEDMANNIDANDLLTQTRNAFYILNGLAPLTTLAKQLAGIIDAHTLIDYSIKLGNKQLDDQGMRWLARYGIDKGMAARIAKAPFEKTDNNFYMANTEAWTSDEFLSSILEETFKYSRPRTAFSKLSQKQLTKHFRKEFPEVTIFTDPDIVKPYFANLQESHGFNSLLGFMTDMRDIPDGGFSVHIDKDMVSKRYESIKNDPRNADQIRADAKQALDEGKIEEEYFHHINNELDAIDLFETADDYLEYIMLHELHHSVIMREVDESVASVENRIDQAAIAYMRDKRASGEELARSKALEDLRKEQEELVTVFRSALNSGVLNTIMSGTPADKPIITDGVVYIPMRIAGQFGMKEHSKYRGYARIENGLMGLPFQFYSFVFANVNKTVGALATGQVKNRAIGSATMMGLAYMSLQLRTPDYVWDEMSAQDRFARSFDMSGIMALYSDIFYTSMHTSLALGGPNITGGLLSPKYNQQASVMDAVTGLAGAGPSWGYDMGKAMINFASGEYGEGGKDIVRNLPFARMWFLKDDVNQITNAWAN